MHAFVPPQVDPLTRDSDPREQRLDQLLAGSDQREDRAVVVSIGVHVQQPRLPAEGVRESLDRRAIAAFGEVRHRLEGPCHVRSLGP